MATASFFLHSFNIKERHYDNSSTNSWDPFQLLTLPTPAGVGGMLELVVTGGLNFISTGFSAESWNSVVTPFYLNLWKRGVEITTFISFSIRKNLTDFKRFSPQTLQILKLVPSVLYKSVGWRKE